MRLSVVLLVASLAGMVGGALLIGRWAVGLAIIADSVAVAWWAWNRDDGQEPAQLRPVRGVPTHAQILERARAP